MVFSEHFGANKFTFYTSKYRTVYDLKLATGTRKLEGRYISLLRYSLYYYKCIAPSSGKVHKHSYDLKNIPGLLTSMKRKVGSSCSSTSYSDTRLGALEGGTWWDTGHWENSLVIAEYLARMANLHFGIHSKKKGYYHCSQGLTRFTPMLV